MFDKGSFLTTIDAAATKLSTAETMRHFKPTARLNMNNFFVLVVFEFSRFAEKTRRGAAVQEAGAARGSTGTPRAPTPCQGAHDPCSRWKETTEEGREVVVKLYLFSSIASSSSSSACI